MKQISQMLTLTFYPYYKEMIDSYKKATEKVNKYADPLETSEDPTAITRPGKLLGRKNVINNHNQ